MQVYDRIKVTGHFKAKVYENGVLIQEFDSPNLVVNRGLEVICQLLGGSAGPNGHITKIAFGDNNVPVSPTDVTLGGSIYDKAVDTITYPAQNKIQWDWALEVGENNGMDIYEYGLGTNDGTALFAKVVKTLVTKTPLIRIVGQWSVEFNTI